MGTCRFCDARLFEDSEFCPRCFAPVVPSEETVEAGLVEVRAAAGRWREARPPRSAADATAPPPRPMPAFSRWRGGPLSFGPGVKVAVSAFVVLLPIIVWIILPLLALEFVLIWSGVVAPLVLRDIWRRRRFDNAGSGPGGTLT